MSLVEKALKKLQTAAAPQRSATPDSGAQISVGRVVAVEDPEPTASRKLRHSMPIGDVTRAIQIDYDALRRNGLLPPESQRRELANQYRTIKRPLIMHAFGEDAERPGQATGSARSIMVSSAFPGEGKTFTSINLALSLSLEKDHTILLVDGDVAKPHVSRTFGVQEEPGLLDVLADPDRPLESVILPTSIPRLSILPAGHRSDTATELLASARMRGVIEKLAALDPQGIVVVDSPPILLTSEARVLASLFGQVVLVVKANKTPQQAVLEAVRIIGEGPRVGLVLNQASVAGPSGYYYGYGYGYGYGEGEGQNEGDSASKGE